MAKSSAPELTRLDAGQLQALLAGLRERLPGAMYEQVEGLLTTLQWVLELIRKKNTTLARLHRLIFGAATEKTGTISPPATAPDPPATARRKGHGRNGADRYVGWPPHWRDLPPETVRGWASERQTVLRTLNECVDQFKNLSVATDEEGRQVMTRRGARQFSAQGKKDLMSAGMYCYLAFRLWLRAGEWVPGIKAENRALLSMQ